MKICKTCESNLDESEYYAHPNTRDKLQSSCKSCAKAKARHVYRNSWYGSWTSSNTEWQRKREKRERKNAAKRGVSKTCTHCKETKLATVDNFYTGAGRHGLKSYCKPCDNKLKTARRRAKKEAKQ